MIGPRVRTMLLLIEVFDTIAGIFVLTEVCLVLLRIEFRFIIPQLQHIHCKRGQSQSDFWDRDQGCRAAEKVHQPSSTASETSSKARPSRFWVVTWVVVRAGIVERSEDEAVVCLGWLRGWRGCVGISGGEDGPFECEWHWRLRDEISSRSHV